MLLEAIQYWFKRLQGLSEHPQAVSCRDAFPRLWARVQLRREPSSAASSLCAHSTNPSEFPVLGGT
jgi:hypothetical protein